MATPGPFPGVLSCGRIGNGVSTGYQCRTEAPTFMGELDQALDEMIAEQPGLFVVKKENKFSEHYDLELAEGYVRRGEGSYTSTCYPAAF